MKKFNFRLARVQRVREVQRDRAQAEYMLAKAEEVRVEQRLQDLRDSARAQAVGYTPGVQVDITATALRASLRAQAAELAYADLLVAAQATQDRGQQLVLADRKVQALDKLKDRHRENWQLDYRRHETRTTDDVSSTRAARKEGDR